MEEAAGKFRYSARTAVVNVRLNQMEREAVRAAAASAGLRASDWIRQALALASKREAKRERRTRHDPMGG